MTKATSWFVGRNTSDNGHEVGGTVLLRKEHRQQLLSHCSAYIWTQRIRVRGSRDGRGEGRKSGGGGGSREGQ
ncbi:hypothetical protein GOBAR_AA19395 [Gossypium barbadense]|uniref:Uncharacterized protein n=1 Tax=Gossypium barbadense TaxID=3634 RepID=A0A2P5XD65_GOSBA|nr:hypothetical protein GOBAR_AA19395 [Gossypium barbadense]